LPKRTQAIMPTAIGLIAASVLLALVHWLVFADARTLSFYLMVDMVFLPLQVLLVSLVLDGMLKRRDRVALLNKLNMAIGVFFGEIGTGLLSMMGSFAQVDSGALRSLRPEPDWRAARYAQARRLLPPGQLAVAPSRDDLVRIKEFLGTRHGFLLALLQNPNLLEHDQFTDVLWAVSHLDAELAARTDLMGIPDSDLQHLCGDASRAYTALVGQWLSYMAHLAADYPYMHSLAVRTNPFDPQRNPEVR